MMVNIDNMTEKERSLVLARREYQRKWRAANKAKVAEHNRRFYEKQAAKHSVEQTEKQRTDD